MRTLSLDCGKCKKQLYLPIQEPSLHARCPHCETDIQVEAFPALLQAEAPAQRGEALLVDNESSCFYHPSKKAVVACEECGRFLCSLCEIELDGRRLCSTCIEKAATKGKMERLQNERVRYDDIALTLAVLPLFFFWISFITAPAALFVVIRYWKAPMSLVYRNRWRLVAALIIAGLELTGWGILGIRLLRRLM